MSIKSWEVVELENKQKNTLVLSLDYLNCINNNTKEEEKKNKIDREVRKGKERGKINREKNRQSNISVSS